MIGQQTLALAVDAYRDLQSRKLFWVTFGLTLLVVGVVAILGVDDKGLQIAFWTIDNGIFNAKNIPPKVFYTELFVRFGLKFWLAWIASILALISTADLFPNLMREGAVDTLLSRPISRFRLFFTRWLLGLLFAAMQVTVFVVPCFLIIGFRGGVWLPGLLVAIPLVLLTYSSLWAICTFFGMLTRSALAAFMLTLLMWFGAGAVNAIDEGAMLIPGLTYFRSVVAVKHDEAVRVAESLRGLDADAAAKKWQADPTLAQSAQIGGVQAEAQQALAGDFAPLEAGVASRAGSRQKIERWSLGVSAVRFFLPKSEETVELTRRWTLKAGELAKESEEADDTPQTENPEVEKAFGAFKREMRLQQAEMDEIHRARPAWLIILSSLLFGSVVLGLAYGLFRRRDF